MFVDKVKIYIKAGDGGDGAVSFHREKYVAAGGPDGGNGGKGGNIVFQVDTNLSTLLDFRYHKKYVAQRGENGGAKRCTGKSAPDLVIKVPRGTIVRNAKNDRIMADLSTDEPQILAKGGNGGRGQCSGTMHRLPLMLGRFSQRRNFMTTKTSTSQGPHSCIYRHGLRMHSRMLCGRLR